MRREITVFLICMLAIFADALSGWQLVELWQTGEVNLNIVYLFGILAIQIIIAIFIVWLSVFLFKRIYQKGLFY